MKVLFALAVCLSLLVSCNQIDSYKCVCNVPNSDQDYEASYMTDVSLSEAKDECDDFENSENAKKVEEENGEELSCSVQ